MKDINSSKSAATVTIEKIVTDTARAVIKHAEARGVSGGLAKILGAVAAFATATEEQAARQSNQYTYWGVEDSTLRQAIAALVEKNWAGIDQYAYASLGCKNKEVWDSLSDEAKAALFRNQDDKLAEVSKNWEMRWAGMPIVIVDADEAASDDQRLIRHFKLNAVTPQPSSGKAMHFGVVYVGRRSLVPASSVKMLTPTMVEEVINSVTRD